MQLFPHIKQNITCCFTGPRPDKLSDDEKAIKEYLRIAIREAIQSGYTYFITGMSRGFDTIAAEIVLEFQEEYDISLIAVIPFLEQANLWSDFDKEKHSYLLEKSRYTICLSDEYYSTVYYTRNRFMVNYSSKVIAYYKRSNGGTKYTLDYAEKKMRNIVNIAEALQT